MACTAAEAEMGVSSRLGFATSNPGTPPADPTERIEFQSDTIREALRTVRTDGIRGTVAVPTGRQNPSQKFVSGSFSCQPTPTDAASWIPRITGAASGANMAETLPCFDVFALRGGYGFKYRENRVASAEFSASEGSPLAMTCGVVGRQRDDPAAAYTWPSSGGAAAVTTGTPWMVQEIVLTIASTTYRFRDFRLTIDNGTYARFMNSLTPTDLPRAERNVTLSLDVPWGTSKALLAAFRSNYAAATIVATQGSNVLTFSLPGCRPMEMLDPTVGGKDEIFLPLNLMCGYVTTPGDECVITIAS
jgi:hypothetical protein